MANERILIIEDEPDILQLIDYNLLKEGYRTLTAESGEEGIKILRAELPDLVLLDLMLPGIDGVDVCKAIRVDPKTHHIQVIMVTAKNAEADIVTGLEVGADDYLAKPFSPRVLLARVKAALRKRKSETSGDAKPIRVGTLFMDPERFQVELDGESVSLTATEFRTLYFLCSSPGRVYSRQQIVDSTQGTDYAVTERSVDVQIVGIRKKLGESADLIETVRGVGYRCRENS